jgi:hypothetical protein
VGPFVKTPRALNYLLETSGVSKRSSTHTTSIPSLQPGSMVRRGEISRNLTKSRPAFCTPCRSLQHALPGRVIVASLPDQYGSRLRFPSPVLL